MHPNGKTSYEILKGKPYRGELVEFGEVVWARDLASASKLEARWIPGVWVGKADLSDEHLIATRGQTKLVRSIRRRPEAERFSLEEVNSFAGMPWDLKEKVYGVPRPPLLLAAPEVPRGVVGVPAGSDVFPAVEGDAQSSRVLYITKALTDKYGLTPGCARCMSGSGVHSGECRARILARLQQDETARAAAAALAVPGVGASSSGDVAMSSPAAAAADEEMAPAVPDTAEKKARTVGSMELEAFVERGLMYEGLGQQDHMKLEVWAMEDKAQDTMDD